MRSKSQPKRGSARPLARVALTPRTGRRFDIVAIGASAGGFHAITETLKSLPIAFPCSIVIVQHLHRRHKSLLSDLVGRLTELPVKQAEHGEVLLPGVVYIAPPDEHLLVGPGKLQLAHTQLVRFARPSIDLLFESVAGTYGSRSIGLVLSGSLRDGSLGLKLIKLAGGTTLVEDPKDAEFGSMPRAAIATECVDHVLPLREIGPMLMRLCGEEKPDHAG